ncbi:MAG: AraC family transcriptional regulator [Anaerolineae bacterium]|nr:AraC family transcriptional regulator [Anaerolineae bacterium]
MSVQFDVFSDILNMIRLSGTVYFRLNFGSDWAMEIPPSPYKMFYIVESGDCWLRGNFTESPIRLKAGDILTFPHGDYHLLSGTTDDIPPQAHTAILEAHRTGKSFYQDDEACTTLVWGHIAFQKNILHPFLEHLPPLIHIRSAERSDMDWLKSITNKIIQESQSPQPGSSVVIDRLSELLHIYMLRAFMLEQATPDSYWKVFSDLQIYQALQHIHSDPAADWTLESLAYKVGVSRTLLATRFKEKVGMTPMRYITLWRMQKALDLLETTTLSTYDVAQRVGYGSEEALTRAFQRQFHMTPSKARQLP